MALRTVCLCDGEYIGIETIFTVIDDKQINLQDKVEKLRIKSKHKRLFCPCGCGSNLILVAGEEQLKEQHFRLKHQEFNKNCTAVIEGRHSIHSKIVLKCWLDDKLGDPNLMARVPICDIDDVSRRFEFTYLSINYNLGLSYCHNRENLSDEKLKLLDSNGVGIHLIYILDSCNFITQGQYPEGEMKIQSRQGFCLFLEIEEADYYSALLQTVYYVQNLDGLWEAIQLSKAYLSEYSINEEGAVCLNSKEMSELVDEVKEKYAIHQEQERLRREEEQLKKEDYINKQRELEETKRRFLAEQEEQQQIEKEKCRAVTEAKRRMDEEIRRKEESKWNEVTKLEVMTRMNQQEEIVYDRKGQRWIKCEYCEKIATTSDFSEYGGPNHLNLGTCSECQRKFRGNHG